MQKLLRKLSYKVFFGRMLRRFATLAVWIAPSRGASLDLLPPKRKIGAVPPLRKYRIVTVHHFEETIGGRAYLVEVMPVGNRWRAQLLRSPGVPTAMMPFYGPTPDEAARQLTDWLALAHRRQTPTVA